MTRERKTNKTHFPWKLFEFFEKGKKRLLVKTSSWHKYTLRKRKRDSLTRWMVVIRQQNQCLRQMQMRRQLWHLTSISKTFEGSVHIKRIEIFSIYNETMRNVAEDCDDRYLYARPSVIGSWQSHDAWRHLGSTQSAASAFREQSDWTRPMSCLRKFRINASANHLNVLNANQRQSAHYWKPMTSCLNAKDVHNLSWVETSTFKWMN